MALNSSTLVRKIPWMKEPGRLQSMGSLRVGHDWVTSFFNFPFHALEKEMGTHSSVLAWRIPGMGKPGGLPSLGSHRVGHDWSDLAVAPLFFIQPYLVVSRLGLLWCYEHPCTRVSVYRWSHFSWVNTWGGGLQVYVQLCNIFPTRLLESVFIPTSDECSSTSTLSPTLNTAGLFNFSHSNACVEVSHCAF